MGYVVITACVIFVILCFILMLLMLKHKTVEEELFNDMKYNALGLINDN